MKTRLLETAVIGLIGDGVVGAALPRRHVARWREGPEPWRRAMTPFARHSGLTRAVGVGEVVVGLLVAAKLPSRP